MVSTVVALSLLGDALLYAVLPAEPGQFGVLVWQVGVLLGINRFVRLITNELAGRLVQKRRSNRPLIWAVVAGSLITAAYALPVGFWGLLILRIAWGACWSLFRVEGYMSALILSSDRNRGRIFAAYQAITRIGQGGGVLIGGFLSDLLGIPRTFLIFGICTFCGLALAIRAPLKRIESAPQQPPEPSVPKYDKTLPRNLRHAGWRRWPLALWGCALAITMTEQMIANLTGRFVAERIGPALPISIGVAGLTGLLLSFRSFGSLLFGPVAGYISDRFGRKRLMTTLVVLQCIFIAGIAFLNRWQFVVACLLLQFACGISSRLIVYTMAGDTAPETGEALHMSRFSTFTDLGTALGPAIAFALYARHGFLPVATVTWLLLAGLLILLWFCFPFPGRQQLK
jgi:MFS family permease